MIISPPKKHQKEKWNREVKRPGIPQRSMVGMAEKKAKASIFFQDAS